MDASLRIEVIGVGDSLFQRENRRRALRIMGCEDGRVYGLYTDGTLKVIATADELDSAFDRGESVWAEVQVNG